MNEYKKTNGWDEWQRYVLKSLDDIKDHNEAQDKKIECNREAFIDAVGELKISMLKEIGSVKSDIKIINTKLTARSAISGFVAGFLPSLTALIYMILKK